MQPAQHVQITNAIGQVQHLEVTGSPWGQHGYFSQWVYVSDGDSSCRFMGDVTILFNL